MKACSPDSVPAVPAEHAALPPLRCPLQAKELRAISTLPKRMLPIRMSLLKRLVLAGARLRQRQQGLAATAALPAAVDVDVTEVQAPAALAASASEAAAVPKVGDPC